MKNSSGCGGLYLGLGFIHLIIPTISQGLYFYIKVLKRFNNKLINYKYFIIFKLIPNKKFTFS